MHPSVAINASSLEPLPLRALPEKPLVSVLMASYNYARYLVEALESLRAQSYCHFEVIICDDGSTDDSLTVAQAFAERDDRFRVLAQPNGGVGSALNAAYAEAAGEILCLLDADDWFAPHKLERVVEAFRAAPERGFVLHGMSVVDETGVVTGRLPALNAYEEGWLAQIAHRRGGRWRSLPTSALAFRRPVAECLFPIPEKAFRSEADAFLSTLAVLLTPVAAVGATLAAYRLHGSNLTGTTVIDAEEAARRLDVLERTTHHVNERLHELRPIATPLDIQKHLNYTEMRLVQKLCEGDLAGMQWDFFKQFARMIWADDLYAPVRKILGLLGFSTALLLPVRWRSAWLTGVLSAPVLRQQVQRILKTNEL